MRDTASGPRVLLKRLRELMQEPLEPQERLDRIVRDIAANMVAEVCSLYVLRADSVLELYATEGLNPNAVHLAQLRLGEGLVGTIAASARPLNLSNAQEHPAFAYLPETGEEIYNSFLGVPVLRAGRTLGVLVVQNKTMRHYRDDEVEALETTAMVIAEMIATGDLARLTRPGLELDLRRPVSFTGLSFNEGVGLGHVVLHEPRIVVTNLFNEDSDEEIKRLDASLGSLRLSIDDMLERREVAFEGEHRQVLEAYRMFANDSGWVRRLEEAIRNGLTAEAAVEKVQSDMRARMLHMTDPYLRERMSDFDDLANRLLRQLMGRGPDDVAASLPKDAIIVARSMGAAELLDYPRDKLRGLVLEDGAATSHVVIVARAMGIPAAGQMRGAVSMAENGDAIIVDGEEGAIHLRPQPDLEAAYAEKVRFRARRQEVYRELRKKPSVTKDGVQVDLLMNAGLAVDLPQLAEAGAAGIGLFRTELQFMVASTFPRAEAQERLYRDVLDAARGKPVTFRTIDIGGDKVLPYFKDTIQEENPALGWRAIRLTLDRPGLLRTQIRALLKACGGRELKLMLPMVTELGEIAQAREIIDREVRHLSRFAHHLPTSLKLGAMLEVPSLLFQLDELMKAVDFVSVGSNDLFQFVMAVDRGNTQLSDRFDALSTPFLRVLKQIADAGVRNQTPVTLCGELAGKPISAMALIGLGYRSISMSPASIGPVKAMLTELPLAELETFFDDNLMAPAYGLPMRALLQAFADDRSIPL
ncbi:MULTISPECIES: phosphoenolpyruvate--protein phosphotransferase [Mesorhizobium]|uniref:phosphoenolpyruvate--protein phosphotransferase n=1 Tax=Mesorhizobium sp. TaxID=1871066 RepID=UPI0004946B49|nr:MULTISPECIES: phosphoenolpyruvate--protein phosphotransferase [Mesorhizobium]RWL16459.1 MAG: phosphoenolpyruvate--protein phosphotransferase [Mesorhizobium sp.]RWM65604.1 MAG: phosphoenolpyruvate--protein phosphotransferase [Mesorhizobium sp.]TIO21248.1 MAG: phosphoenolpyruvate--protein phosphotransferase [Mesorhizobium sp.]TJV54751.1 MAG: phosphoenolpyruvate--protein phosphotransferase [Mesorhizobium sp.]